MSAIKERINVAVLATGGRSKYVVKNLLDDSKGNVRVVSVFDPDKELAEEVIKFWESPEAQICDSYQEAIDAPGVDWVMVFSPNAYHKEHILASFDSGKHVFSEKPLATTIEDCEAIYQAHQKTDLLFATGFVLRYAPIYRKAKELLESGKLGKILSIDANENIDVCHGSYIMKNWRRKSEISGPHILEKCCHDLDLINWFCDSIPSMAASFGGSGMFIPENEHLREKYGKKTFAEWNERDALETPFNADNDMMDNQVGILQYRNGIRVMFQATMSNAMPERRMYFSCTEGTMVVELYSSKLTYRCIGDEGVTEINFGGDGHGGGDSYIMKELYETMSTGMAPKCSGDEGLESAVASLALDQAARQQRIIDLEPIWREMNR